MASEQIKTSEIPVVNSLTATSRLVAYNGSNTVTISLSNLFGNSASVPVINTPSTNASLTCPAGAVFTDGSYLYVAVSNNHLGRVALDTNF